MEINLEPYLQETKYCDFSHPSIQKLAKEIGNKYEKEEDKIKNLFFWVKENIKFEFDWWRRKASETLKLKKGMCTNKSNLLIALLRALKIPSGYGILKVETIKFYGPLMCPSFKYLVSPQTKHFYTGIFFNGKWIRCDPSVDSDLAESIRGKSVYGELSGFDINDKEIQSFPGVLKREEFLFTADEILSSSPRRLTKSAQNLLNFYLLFLRENKNFIEKFSLKEEIEKQFMNWLSKKNRQLFEYFKKFIKT